eukprot:CAMPEP_0168478480 /NCGR_PEP_ID=MMETSP0228-20121227/62979_1 /TAXON_ID=133427 /ORGANISM="Protoceratium reticulatum, Strain CCCM 535 (=CCMP 1889)" /LENGTH=192 /DNA_ID=CAMNT_0008494741 /DNA_START=81 /DNA_END=656 /DNA_ORIENTATION=+
MTGRRWCNAGATRSSTPRLHCARDAAEDGRAELEELILSVVDMDGNVDEEVDSEVDVEVDLNASNAGVVEVGEELNVEARENTSVEADVDGIDVGANAVLDEVDFGVVLSRGDMDGDVNKVVGSELDVETDPNVVPAEVDAELNVEVGEDTNVKADVDGVDVGAEAVADGVDVGVVVEAAEAGAVPVDLVLV